MKNNSRKVESNQQGIHERLVETVEKHLRSTLRSPIAEHSRTAFQQVNEWKKNRASSPLILDSGCGTGMSTQLLAQAHPEASIIGIDRSVHRLHKTAELDGYLAPISDNACLVQADLVDFWRLALGDDWRLLRHTILYPNPYPKSAHLQRRWHGHGVFPTLLKLGGEIELRSNWRLYLEEFTAAVESYDNFNSTTPTNTLIETIDGSNPLTLFEKKYHDSGQPLYKIVIDRRF